MNKKRLLDNFLQFVQIDSESKNEKAFKDYLKTYFETRLKLEVYEDNAGETADSNGNNLYISIPGDTNLKPIILSAHMDTVKPGIKIVPLIKNNKVISQGETILGADDKAGIAIIIEAIESILENNENHRPIEIIFTIFEEGGLFGAKNTEIERLKGTNILVFDTGGNLENIVNKSVSQNKIDITVYGKAAHAGIEPEKGISALEVTAKAISIMKLGRIDDETTANIGTIQGGEGTNVVMPKVVLKGEVRSHNQETLINQTEHIKNCFKTAANEYGVKVDVIINEEYPAFYTPEDSDFAKEVKTTFNSMGINSVFKKTGGGSDANIFAKNNKKALIISCGMNKVHTVNEYLDIAVFNRSAEFLYKYLKGEK